MKATDLIRMGLLSGGGAFDPSQLSNKVLWVRADETSNTGGEVDIWTDKFEVLDLVKSTDPKRPNVVAAQDNGLDVVRFTPANVDFLTQVSALNITDDFTIYLRFKANAPTSTLQWILENVDNGAAYDNNKGFVIAVVNSLIRIDFRGTPGVQRLEFAFTDTGRNILCVKHKANTTQSARVVKLNGALKSGENNLSPCVPATSTLKVGSNYQNFPFDGELSEVIITSDYHNNATEARVIDYLKTRYAASFTNAIDIGSQFNFSGWTNLGTVASKRFNGLFPILRGDSKYDFFSGTIEGDLYYGLQGATISNWTWTQIGTGLGEIQSVKAFYYNSKWHVLSAHKVTGLIKLHIPQGDIDGTYDVYTIKSVVVEIQDIKVQAIDSSGLPQFSYSFQGTSAGIGGVYWMKFTGADITDSADWTTYEIIQHNAAWWHTPIFSLGGNDYIGFSARTNAANSSEVPGGYLVQLNADRTLAGTESTLSAVDADWLHVRLGNYFGNGVQTDIAIETLADGKIHLFDSSNSWAETVIDLNPTNQIENIINVGDPFNTGRDSLIAVYIADKARLTYWNGLEWTNGGGDLAATGAHPYDNEGYLLDLDNSGTVQLIVDDNEASPTYGQPKRCTIGGTLIAKPYV